MPTIQDVLLLCFLGAVIALESDLRKHHDLLREVIKQSQEKEIQLAMQQAAIAVVPTKSSTNLATVTVTATITKACTFGPLTVCDAMAGLFGYLLIWFTILSIILAALLGVPREWPLKFCYAVRDLFARVDSVFASAVPGDSKTTTTVQTVSNTSGDIPGGTCEANKELRSESEKFDPVPSTVNLISSQAASTSIDVNPPPFGSKFMVTKFLEDDAKPIILRSEVPAAEVVSKIITDAGGIHPQVPSIEQNPVAVEGNIAVTGNNPSATDHADTKLNSDNKSVVSVTDLVDKVVEKENVSSIKKTDAAANNLAIKTDGEPASIRQTIPTIALDRRSGIAEKDVAYDESLRVLHSAELTLNDEFIKVMASKLKHEPVNSVDEDFILQAECYQLSFPKVSRTHSKRLKITLHLHAAMLVEAMLGLKIVKERMPELAMSQEDIPFQLAKEILDTCPSIARQEIAVRVKEIYKDTVVGVWLPKVAEMVSEEVAARDPPFEKRVSHIVW